MSQACKFEFGFELGDVSQAFGFEPDDVNLECGDLGLVAIGIRLCRLGGGPSHIGMRLDLRQSGLGCRQSPLVARGCGLGKIG